MKPKNYFFIKIRLKKSFWTKRTKNTQKRRKHFFGQNHCKVDGPSIPEIIKVQPFYHKLWKNLFFEVGQYNFTAAKKGLFLPFLDTKPFFAMKITNHHDIQLTPYTSESWDQDGFLEPGFGYHQLHIISSLG